MTRNLSILIGGLSAYFNVISENYMGSQKKSCECEKEGEKKFTNQNFKNLF